MSLMAFNIYYIGMYGEDKIERNVWGEDADDAIDQFLLDYPDVEIIDVVLN